MQASDETQPLPEPVAEETRLLAHIRQVLLEHPEGPGASEDEIVAELLRLRDDIRNAKAEDQGAMYQQATQLTHILDQVRKGRNTAEVDPDSPYFGHLRVTEEGRTRDVYLGKATRLNQGLRIVDWRNAPISKIFYRYKEGDDYVEEVAERVREGIVDVRRTLHIHRGELLRVGTSNGSYVKQSGDWRHISAEAQRLAGGQGQAMRRGSVAEASLGSGAAHRADKHLPDIAALIDPEQFHIITEKDSGVVVLRGSAGSGKTTVALHRIAYLAYANPNRFQPSRMIVVVWGRGLAEYTAHVLPALGVDGVNVVTWSKWARKLVRSHFPDLPQVQADDTPEPVTRIKVHAAVEQLLAAHIAKTKAKATPRQAIEDWGHVLTDTTALREALGDDIGPKALTKAVEWITAQQVAIQAFLDGERKIDARLDVEDDALLLRAYQLRVGRLQRKGNRALAYAHMVLDEVQDFSPIEVKVLLDTCDKYQSVTMAGDTRQHISEAQGFSNWTEFLERTGIETQALSTLDVAYRSTHPVTRFALDVLDDPDQPPPRTTRDGPPVELFRFSDHGACVAFLAEELRKLTKAEPLANVALLTPDKAISEIYYDGLEKSEVPDVRRVINQKFAFAAGIDVVEADQVKGLEFDYVVIVEASGRYWPDTSHHRRLMHVAATRAIHQLWVTSVQAPSTMLPKAQP